MRRVYGRQRKREKERETANHISFFLMPPNASLVALLLTILLLSLLAVVFLDLIFASFFVTVFPILLPSLSVIGPSTSPDSVSFPPFSFLYLFYLFYLFSQNQST